jgi:hypothetical protein
MINPEEQFFKELYSHYGRYRKGKILNHMLNQTPIKNSIGEIDTRWCRLPSPGDGSCLFHSVIMNLLSDEARPDIARSLRLALANSLTIVEYSELQGGILSLMNMQEILQNNLSLQSFNHVPRGITENRFKEEVDNIISKHSSIIDIVKFREVFINEIEKLGFYRDETEEVFKGFYLSTYIRYTSILKDLNQWADQSIALLLSQKLNINIIVISSTNMKVYKDASTFNPDLLSIVIFNIDGAHFEPMVRRESEEEYRTTFTLEELETIF